MSSLFSPSPTPSVVLCLSKDAYSSSQKLNSAFYDASLNFDPLSDTPINFITLDCSEPLKNGKSISETYSLDMSLKPATVFLTNSPTKNKLIKFTSSHLKSGSHLTKAIKANLEPRSIKIKKTGDLNPLCFDLPYCVAILKSGGYTDDFKKDLKNVILKYPEVREKQLLT